MLSKLWPFSTIQKLHAEVTSLLAVNNALHRTLSKQRDTIASLQAQLAQARKNDTPRGPDGRFRKVGA